MKKLICLKEKMFHKGQEIACRAISRKRNGFNELVVVCGLAIVGVLVLIACKAPSNTMFSDFLYDIQDGVVNTLSKAL